MKRVLLAITIMMFFANISAQMKQPFDGELYIGVGGGGLATKIDFVPSVAQTFYYSYQGGVSAKYISEKHLGLLTEINLSRKGWREEYEPADGYSFHRSLTYIDVPFMTHIYFGNSTRFIINLGPQISMLLGDSSDMSQELADYVRNLQENNPDIPIGTQYGPFSEMRRFDYGLMGGVGIELNTGVGNFNLEGRYYFGLGDIFNNRRSENAYFSRSANRVIGAKLTYYIKIR